jgi:sulfopyruvate decarboxylase TPP-binding subunit
MSLDNISMVAQLSSSVATFEVPILLLRSLRLQHKDSVTSLGVGMTNSLAELLTIMSKDAEFSDLFLRGVESDGTLNKIETHRYSLQCIYERVFLADSGDMGI